ncbi:MAG: type II toxin-antitoxin system HipA family toxin [Lacunisphaera sp.]|nr:type II toxin-antitoxin system HipA family toxin [Lacunisphaera sp.]
MSQLTVRYLGQKVGQLAETPAGLAFEYEAGFIATDHELSPFHLPLRPGVQLRGGDRLPGLFDDSLPDAWGRRVLLEWFRQQGTAGHQVTPLAMLAFVGAHGMGALTYGPARDAAAHPWTAVSLDALQAAALKAEQAGEIDLNVLAGVGSSAGGARPKALIALSRQGSARPLAGAGEVPTTHDAWLVKFDTSPDNSQGPMEEAYALMARAAGVELPETRLLETKQDGKVRRHFAVKRFDREGAERIHHHTLAAMLHLGGGDLNYETFLRVARRLTQDETEVWHAFRRAAFNVLASNRDDHGKNHGFLYRDRKWQLGPAYDLTFSSPQQLPERGMAILGERRGAGVDHLLRLAENEGLARRSAEGIIEQVRASIARWREFADQAQVPILQAAEIGHALTVGPRQRLGPSVG